MSEPQVTSDALVESSPDLEALRREYQSLRVLFQAVVVTMIVFTGSLTIFLWRQTSLLRRQVQASRPMVNQLANDYQKIGGPMVKSFLSELHGFSKTNPDFTPILTKYMSSPTNSPSPALPSLSGHTR
jgi:hypothetical protein